MNNIVYTYTNEIVMEKIEGELCSGSFIVNGYFADGVWLFNKQQQKSTRTRTLYST